MNRLSRIGMVTAVIFVTSFCLRELLKLGAERSADTTASSTLSALRQNSVEKYPEKNVSEAVLIAAKEYLSSTLAGTTAQETRVAKAAEAFMGFYLTNTRERRQYCDKQGADISPFVAAFKKAHLTELHKAESVLAQQGYNVERFYDMSKYQLQSINEQQMKDFASKGAATVKEACQQFAVFSEEITAENHFSKVHPEAYKELIGEQ